MSSLFSPFSLGSIDLANRIVVAPMCQYSAINGCATDWHVMHLGQLALSGAGLLIVEATAVQAEGRISPLDLGLYNDANEEALARVVQAIRRYSSMPLGIQLAHAGRKASCAAPWDGGRQLTAEQGGWATVAPSALPFAAGDAPPAELDEAGIAAIIQAFVRAAERSHRLGFNIIEVHAAHGYLLHEFLSPLSNQRQDAYGGDLHGRMRLLLEVYAAVRAAVPEEVAVGVRISATDWEEGGWDVQQSTTLAAALQALGCAYLHVSGGGLTPTARIPVAPGYQIPLARHIRGQVSMPVIGVGLITEAQQAEAIIAEGEADLVALARAMLYNPRWPWHAAAELGAQVAAPRPYWRAPPQDVQHLFRPD